MAKSYGGINYPDTIEKVMKDFGMLKLLKSVISKAENKNMLAYLEKRPKPSRIFTEWIGPQASNKVPLSSKIKKASSDLIKGPNGTKEKEWEKIGSQLEKEFISEFNSNVLPAFFRTSEFYDFHCKNALIVIGTKYGMPKDVAKRLGIKDVRAVEFILMDVLAGKMGEAKSDAQKLIKKEKFACTDKEMIAAMTNKSAGKLKKKGMLG